MTPEVAQRILDEHRARLAKQRAKAQHKENTDSDSDFGGYLPTEEEIERACQELRQKKKQRGEEPDGEMGRRVAQHNELYCDAFQVGTNRSVWNAIGAGSWRRTIHNGNTRD